ncbi:WYL domain-containing protein [Empedobacter falsenii]
MARREQMFRLMNISNFLKSKPNGVTFREVQLYIEEKYKEEEFDNDLAFSEKTFKRDRKLLKDLFKIETKFSRSTMLYQIVDDVESNQTIFDNLLLVNAYKKTADQANILLFEKRQASGLENLDGLIHAIKNSKIISCSYTKYWEGIPNKKVLEPYAMKEFRNRWYLIAKDRNDNDFTLKTYGLDRISNLEIHSSTFVKNNIVNVEDMFVNSFGIISTLGQEPTKITLSLIPWQGMYVKSLPIHHSQKILVDNENELKLELNLVPTYDFYQEILTHNERLLSLEPKVVREKFLKFLEVGLNNLKNQK